MSELFNIVGGEEDSPLDCTPEEEVAETPVVSISIVSSIEIPGLGGGAGDGVGVSSINGDSGTNGAVTIDSDDVAEGSTNKYASTANVDAAGATMNTDTNVSGNSWVLDEDDMVSNSASAVPTQQSVKAYVDANAGGAVKQYLTTDYKVTVGASTYNTSPALVIPLLIPPACTVNNVRLGCTKTTTISAENKYWQFNVVRDVATDLGTSAFNTLDNSELSAGYFVDLIVDQNQTFDGSQTLAVEIYVEDSGGVPDSLNGHNLTFQVEFTPT